MIRQYLLNIHIKHYTITNKEVKTTMNKRIDATQVFQNSNGL